MTETTMGERVARLEEKMSQLDRSVATLTATVQLLDRNLDEILISQRAFKWIMSTALALGPALGAFISYLFFR